jgi:hypothetical protein
MGKNLTGIKIWILEAVGFVRSDLYFICTHEETNSPRAMKERDTRQTE